MSNINIDSMKWKILIYYFREGFKNKMNRIQPFALKVVFFYLEGQLGFCYFDFKLD